MRFVLYFIVLCALKILNVDVADAGHAYNGLPPIFVIDDYEKCRKEEKVFCKVSVLLRKGESNVSHYWKLIEDSLGSSKDYNHNELLHAICVEDFCAETNPGNRLDEYQLSKCYNKKYEHLGLAANISSYNCNNHDDMYKAGSFDKIWLTLVVYYLCHVTIATLWTYLGISEQKKIHLISVDFEKTFLEPFSLAYNWKKLRKENARQNSDKLRCMQGIRFYSMTLIILFHTFFSYIIGYVSNTDYFEELPESSIKLGFRNLFLYQVQTFFLFSAFLLSYNMFRFIETTPTFSIRVILLKFLNRYLRIVPPVIVMLGFGTTIWVWTFFCGPIKDLYSDVEHQHCIKNWWTTLLFINNHYNPYEVCYMTTWYLSADTQLYALSLTIFVLIWKFKRNTGKILASAVAIGILIPVVITYVYDLDIIFRVTPENAKEKNYRTFEFNAIYFSSYTNLPTYMIGICSGYVYYKLGNRNVFESLLSRLLWATGFIGLPVLVIVMSSYHYSRFTSALLCAILKPLYALGMAIGIFGMSQKVGGILRKACEWKPAVFMGNFTYSTYLTHFGIVFYRTATAKEPLYVSDYVLLMSFIYDAVRSFLAGFIIHLIVEMPASHIQNRFVPQVRRPKQAVQ